MSRLAIWNFGMRKLLWLQCAVAFGVLLFAPETACVASHLVSSRDVVLGKYYISIPLRWGQATTPIFGHLQLRESRGSDLGNIGTAMYLSPR
jgi:hypothetical protein